MSRPACVRPGRAAMVAACGLLAFHAAPVWADENGASIYLLGSGGPGAGAMPPLKGVYLDNTIYVYDAGSKSQRNFVIGGNVVANVDTVLAANFTTLLWVPSTNFLGGTLALGVAVPFGAPMIDASAVITGPMGNQIGLRKHDSALVVGDPIATAALGWKAGKVHVSVSTMLNIPVGYYREGQLANLSFHRWAGDASLGVSWIDEHSGWDLSGKVGVTFNGTNPDTDYTSGTDLHLEASIEKKLSPHFSLGVQGYHFQQISDDTGSGAVLGPYRGRVSGVGGTVAYSTVMGRSPATFRLRVFQEFDTENRMEGTAAMLSLTLPLSMKMPARGGE